MTKAVLKLLVFTVVIVILSGVLIMAMARSRREGKLLHCKNNLRYLGILYDTYATSMPDPLPGRGKRFWHQLIMDLGEDKKHPEAGGLTALACPVLGRTSPHKDRPDDVDYRGPGRDRDTYGPLDPVAADRAGNHGIDPGWVLLYNQQMVQRIAVTGSDDAWRKASETTSD